MRIIHDQGIVGPSTGIILEVRPTKRPTSEAQGSVTTADHCGIG